ncbi:MAG: helix-turn-helix domain-containing protein [Bacteroidales bacterium]|nr:helix-turn-helix domain-containing protein [Bacteroidales bacterium]
MENKEIQVTERIKNVLIPRYAYNFSEFCRLVHIEKSTLSSTLNRQSAPSLKHIIKIVEAIPEISLEWLILGKEPMLKTTQSSSTANNNLELLIKSKDETIEAQKEAIAAQKATINKLEAELKKMAVSPVGIADAV